jgi:hypothetical protein
MASPAFYQAKNVNNIIYLCIHCDTFFHHVTNVNRPNIRSLPFSNFFYSLIDLYIIFLFSRVHLYFMFTYTFLPSWVLCALSHFGRPEICSPASVQYWSVKPTTHLSLQPRLTIRETTLHSLVSLLGLVLHELTTRLYLIFILEIKILRMGRGWNR